MSTENPYRMALLVVIGLTMSVTVYHRLQAAKSGETISHKQEGYLFASVLRLAGLALWGSTLAYLIAPSSVHWAAVQLPVWLRWCGVTVGLGCSLLMYWTLSSLGKNLTDTVVTRVEATLVTEGPYRWVRHPFYVTAALLMASVTVLTANGLIGLTSLLVLALLAIRTPQEEQHLVERFGQQYRDYMAKTGRFIPWRSNIMRLLLILLLLGHSLSAAEPQVHRDLPYAQPKHERQTLDVYAPTQGQGHPIVLWIHGGGWRAGNKSGVQRKPGAFVEKGFVFVSTNYRFVPNVTVSEMAGDIAQAIRWTHDHAREFGGDPQSIFVMGHSAGAHLAALVCTDDRYLKAEGLSLSIIKGCVPVDTAVYDIVKQIERVAPAEPARAASYRSTFGDLESQRELSPVTHVAKGKGIPPFLILHVASRPDARWQSQLLGQALQDAGVSAQVVSAEGKDHGTINADLGLPQDKPSQELFAFVKAHGFQEAPGLAESIDSLKKLGARIMLDDQGRILGVNLGERRVTDADLVHLRGLEHLQELDLTRTRIEGPGLVNLKELPALRTLYLTETKVDDAGIAHLQGLKTLGFIGLSGTKITDATLVQLRELTELKKLFCLGTNVSDAGVADMQRALPRCLVIH